MFPQPLLNLPSPLLELGIDRCKWLHIPRPQNYTDHASDPAATISAKGLLTKYDDNRDDGDDSTGPLAFGHVVRFRGGGGVGVGEGGGVGGGVELWRHWGYWVR